MRLPLSPCPADNTYRRDELLATEWDILDTLQYELTQPTTRTFLPRVLKANRTCVSEEEEELLANLCYLLAELALLDYKAATSSVPSQVAASCVLLSNWILFEDKPSWTPLLEATSGGYKPSQLQPVADRIYAALLDTYARREHLPAIREKYASPKFQSISSHPDIARQLGLYQQLPASLFADRY